MSNKCKNLSAEILELNRKIMSGEERQAKLEQQITDHKAAYSLLMQEKDLVTSKERELQDKLKEKGDEIYELNKKIGKLESDSFILQ